ncbi:hypothetical protein UT300007_13240 [Clostridium sp. CTA-7]
MEWYEVKEQRDIDYLLKEYCGFHDSCLVELNYKSGAYVDKERSMCFGTSEERELHMIFQSQCTGIMLELLFTNVKKFHVAGWQEYYSCDIFDCYLEIRNDLIMGRDNNLIVWADTEGFNPKEEVERYILNEQMTTYVIAANLKWRYLLSR